MDLIFFGMQGAGKGTLGKYVAEKYGLEVFETGGALRTLAQEDSELGKKVKETIESGQLVSDELVMEIVEDFLGKLPEGKNMIFDGIPRTSHQAELLMALLDKYERQYKAVLIDIAKDTALTRLTTRRVCKDCKTVYAVNHEGDNCKCGGELMTRADDNPEAIQKRLDTYENETVPAINKFEDKLIKINGEPVIEKVQELAVEALNPIIG
ncbi:nucleoside monophosphate kinase [Candidatus Peregrinibacteria bacterium]|jgi:adenylate kinase|nr:nucleoside monophosphate kinase [Candidatus Peregrinibacteria bacterium]